VSPELEALLEAMYNHQTAEPHEQERYGAVLERMIEEALLTAPRLESSAACRCSEAALRGDVASAAETSDVTAQGVTSRPHCDADNPATTRLVIAAMIPRSLAWSVVNVTSTNRAPFGNST